MQLQTREKRMLIALGIVAIISGFILYRVYFPSSSDSAKENTLSSTQKQEEKKSQPNTQSASRSGGARGSRTPSGGASSGSQTVSIQEFESHSTLNSCWVLLDGEVYDITNFLGKYESYQETILSFCGTVGFEAGFIEGNKSLAESVKIESQKIGTIS